MKSFFTTLSIFLIMMQANGLLSAKARIAQIEQERKDLATGKDTLIQNRKRMRFDVHAKKPGNYKEDWDDVKIVLSTGKPAPLCISWRDCGIAGEGKILGNNIGKQPADNFQRPFFRDYFSGCLARGFELYW